MRNTFKINPEDVLQQPVFRQFTDDPSRGVSEIRVARRPAYDNARKGDVLHLNGLEYVIIDKELLGSEGEGTIIFNTDHLGTIMQGRSKDLK